MMMMEEVALNESALHGEVHCQAKHMFAWNGKALHKMPTPCSITVQWRYTNPFMPEILVCQSFYEDAQTQPLWYGEFTPWG